MTMEQIIEKINLELIINNVEYGSMEWDNKGDKRYIFDFTLKSKNGEYTSQFGQSIVMGDTEPTLEDILGCMTWNDPESFEFWCDNFGYDNDSRKAERIYNNCVDEYERLGIVFGSTFDEMCEIAWEF